MQRHLPRSRRRGVWRHDVSCCPSAGCRMTPPSRLTYRNVLILVHDLLATTLALFAAFYIRFEGGSSFWARVPQQQQNQPKNDDNSKDDNNASNLMTTKWRFISLPDALNI